MSVASVNQSVPDRLVRDCICTRPDRLGSDRIYNESMIYDSDFVCDRQKPNAYRSCTSHTVHYSGSMLDTLGYKTFRYETFANKFVGQQVGPALHSGSRGRKGEELPTAHALYPHVANIALSKHATLQQRPNVVRRSLQTLP